MWGCGMPPQPMVKTSRPPLGITHARLHAGSGCVQ
ncbi:hypothetical protein [Pseudomonas graminis]